MKVSPQYDVAIAARDLRPTVNVEFAGSDGPPGLQLAAGPEEGGSEYQAADEEMQSIFCANAFLDNEPCEDEEL